MKMRRALMALLLGMSVFPAVSADGRIRVACVGDSITYGYLIENHEADSYPGQLARILEERFPGVYEVRNFGDPGKGVVFNAYKNVPAYAESLAWHPQIVVSNLGANDWASLDERFPDEYVALLRRYEGAALYLWSPLAPLTSAHSSYGTPAVAKVNQLICGVASRTGARTIDLHSPLAGREGETIMADGIHPNEAGSRLIAEAVAAAITKRRPTLDDLRDRARALIAEMTLEEKLGLLQNTSKGVERLGLSPYQWWSEALHGVAINGRTTVFPEPIGMAATFDPELIREVGEAIACEARAKYAIMSERGWTTSPAGLSFWSPNVNIFRDPRWGRGMETWGEDPYLTGTMAGAFICGLQGDDPVYLKVAACAKHFAVHSGPERLRHEFDARPSRKDLFETYLPAFEMCVREASVASVMGAYNRVYGESASASRFLLTDLLRGTWGFDGVVFSDCGAICDIWKTHRIVGSAPEAAALAIKSGLSMECGSCFESLPQAVELGLLDESEIDAALLPSILLRYRLGNVTPDPDCPYTAVDRTAVGAPWQRAIARRAAQESMVLLKNENGLLPLDPSKGGYGVCGAGAVDQFSLFGNYYGVSEKYVSYLEGIVGALEPGVPVYFKPGYLYGGGEDSRTDFPWDGDVVIAVLGHTNAFEGEEGETIATGEANGDHLTLDLPAKQKELLGHLKWMHDNTERKIVTIVTGGSPIDLRPVLDASHAVVFAWYAGEEGGRALADLLFGRADFTGRLPITFPESADALPPFEDYSMAGRGYRYQTEGVLFPFGYGLSYATFAYGALRVEKGEMTRVVVPVENTGSRDGTAVVQLYAASPNAGRGQPVKSLVGFRHVPLSAGERTEVTFEVPADRLVEIAEDGTRLHPEGEWRFSVGE